MQIKKEEVRESIVSSALKEFSEYGFQKASLRRIAEKAGVTKGNIYTYFASKDELFRELMLPAYNYLKATIRSHKEKESFTTLMENRTKRVEDHQKEFLLYIQNLLTWREELKLLFLHSAGSSLANFREEIFELYTQSAYETCLYCSGSNMVRTEAYMDMFIHSMASLYLRFIEETLVHEPDSDSLEAYIKLIASLVHHSYSLFLKGGE